jgi:hypothetical protein
MVSLNSIRRKFHTARSFPGHDRRLFIQAWFILLLVDLGLRLLSFRRVQGWLARGQSWLEIGDYNLVRDEIRRTRKLVDLAARYSPYRMTCLRRSLTMQRLLAQQGIRSELRFGARREKDALQAHAWLEYQGIPIGEPETLDERFTPLVGFSSKHLSNS